MSKGGVGDVHNCIACTTVHIFGSSLFRLSIHLISMAKGDFYGKFCLLRNIDSKLDSILVFVVLERVVDGHMVQYCRLMSQQS